jgi:RNAse (barnase) inhibitor barstar
MNTTAAIGELMPPEREMEDPRGDGWFVTSSGEKFFPLNPNVHEIQIKDIAFALSNICRFGGHVEFYSVAEHCCHVSDACPPALKFLGLMHDATEAYMGDMVRPLKQQMDFYREVEDMLWNVVARAFNLPLSVEQVKIYDNRALLAERNYLMVEGPNTRDWYWDHAGLKPLDCQIKCWPPQVARREFMNRYNQLNGL